MNYRVPESMRAWSDRDLVALHDEKDVLSALRSLGYGDVIVDACGDIKVGGAWMTDEQLKDVARALPKVAAAEVRSGDLRK